MTDENANDAAFLPGLEFAQEAFPPLPICWRALSPHEYEEQLEALDDWTAWLASRYALDHRTIPPCWPEHGALLEELSALRTAWLTAFAVTSAGDAPLAWHTHFAAGRQRLTDWVSRTGCRAGEHRPDSAGHDPSQPS
jgi:hypothetical protein